MSTTIKYRLPQELAETTYPHPPLLAQLAIGFAVLVTKWDVKRRTRKQLWQLSDHLLNDIGIERDAANTEARRPFWS